MEFEFAASRNCQVQGRYRALLSSSVIVSHSIGYDGATRQLVKFAIASLGILPAAACHNAFAADLQVVEYVFQIDVAADGSDF